MTNSDRLPHIINWLVRLSQHSRIVHRQPSVSPDPRRDGRPWSLRQSKNSRESWTRKNQMTRINGGESNAGCVDAPTALRALLGWTDECVRPYVILRLP